MRDLGLAGAVAGSSDEDRFAFKQLSCH